MLRSVRWVEPGAPTQQAGTSLRPEATAADMPACAAALLEELERTGAASPAFWRLFWGHVDELSADELARVRRAIRPRHWLVGMALQRAGAVPGLPGADTTP